MAKYLQCVLLFICIHHLVTASEKKCSIYLRKSATVLKRFENGTEIILPTNRILKISPNSSYLIHCDESEVEINKLPIGLNSVEIGCKDGGTTINTQESLVRSVGCAYKLEEKIRKKRGKGDLVPFGKCGPNFGKQVVSGIAAAASILLSSTSRSRDGPCFLDMHHDVRFPPLVFDKILVEMVYPTNYIITMFPLQRNYISCGENNIRISRTSTGKRYGDLQCKHEELYLDGAYVEWETLDCTDGTPRQTERASQIKICSRGLQQRAIGWMVGNKFVHQIEICIDERNQNPIITAHTLNKPNYLPRIQGSDRPPFEPEGGEMDIAYRDFDNRLNREYQMRGAISRGHLAANSDFIYPSERGATFYYINMLPQWKIINSGPWEEMEANIQRCISPTDFRILTGGIGHDVAQNGRDITLLDGGVAPVPKAVWKVVYNPTSMQGIAFVGMNSLDGADSVAYLRGLGCSTKFCRKQNWQFDAPAGNVGLVGCCEVNTLRESVRVIPVLNIDSVLKFSA